MEITEFVFNLLLLFFPGLICAYIIDHLTMHKPKEISFFLLQSFILGIASYFIYWSILKILHLLLPMYINSTVVFLNRITQSGISFSFKEITFVTCIAVLLGAFIGFCSHRKVFNRFARFIGLTNKFGELDVWGYLFNLEDVVWVTVRDHKNNLIYDGWVQAFSDDSESAELLLRDVSIYKNDSGDRLYQVGMVYLCRNREEISIECRTIEIDEQIKWKDNKNEPKQTKSNTETSC